MNPQCIKSFRSILLSSVLCALSCLQLSAQTNDTFDPGSLGFVDFLISPPADSQAGGLSIFSISPFAIKPPGVELPFWKKKQFYAGYKYSLRDSKLVDDTRTDAHEFSVEYNLTSTNAFSLGLAFLYSDLSSDAPNPKHVDARTYGPQVIAGQDLFSFCPSLSHNGSNILALNIGLRYGHSDRTEITPAARSDVDSDTYILFPQLIYIHKVSSTFSLVALPQYTVRWTDLDSKTTGKSSTRDELFSFTGRCDWKMRPDLVVIPAVRWNHDLNFQRPVGVTIPKRQDWAEFSLALRHTLSQKVNIRATYGYEAFHPNYSVHFGQLRLEIDL